METDPRIEALCRLLGEPVEFADHLLDDDCHCYMSQDGLMTCGAWADIKTPGWREEQANWIKNNLARWNMMWAAYGPQLQEQMVPFRKFADKSKES